MTGIALILQSLAQQGVSLGRKVQSLPEYHIVKVKYPCPGDFGQVAEGAKKLFEGEINDTDGIRIDMNRSWVHIRMSNTEPVARVIAEAETLKEAESLAGKVGELFAGKA
jgi:phosphomannomutase